MRTDIISIIEAAYLLEPADDAAWLTELLTRARPALDRGLGMFAYHADFTNLPHGSRPIALGCPEGWHQMFDAFTNHINPELRVRLAALSPSVTTLRHHLGKKLFASLHPSFIRVARLLGVRDLLGIRALDPTARGLILCALLPRQSKPLRPLVATWSRITVHLAAGYRLRRHMAQHRRVLPDWSHAADAIWDPRGKKVVHLEDEAVSRGAREALLVAAERMDRARGSMRRTAPEEAVALWLGMAAGRWSLVEQEERDGRRYLLALRNDARTPEQSSLSHRERQVLRHAALGHPNKLIADELGIANSTVSVLLARAQTKLGARSRNEMLALFNAASEVTPPREEQEQ